MRKRRRQRSLFTAGWFPSILKKPVPGLAQDAGPQRIRWKPRIQKSAVSRGLTALTALLPLPDCRMRNLFSLRIPLDFKGHRPYKFFSGMEPKLLKKENQKSE